MTDQQDRDQLQAALDVAQARITELEAELTKRDSQNELWRLVKVWRTRANEEFERAERAEAERDDQKRRADALERALRRLSFAAQTTGGTAGPDQGLQDAIAEAERALTDQPADAGEADACYLIRTDKGLWRPKAAGYTSSPAEAGRYTYKEAQQHTRGLGPEKQAKIIHERDAPAYERPCCARTREEERERAALACDERADELLQMQTDQFDQGSQEADRRGYELARAREEIQKQASYFRLDARRIRRTNGGDT